MIPHGLSPLSFGRGEGKPSLLTDSVDHALAACPEVLEEGRGRARCTVVSPQMHGQSCRWHVADDSHWLSPSHSYCRETGSLLTFTHGPQRGRMKRPVWGSTFASVCACVCVNLFQPWAHYFTHMGKWRNTFQGLFWAWVKIQHEKCLAQHCI